MLRAWRSGVLQGFSGAFTPSHWGELMIYGDPPSTPLHTETLSDGGLGSQPGLGTLVPLKSLLSSPS